MTSRLGQKVRIQNCGCPPFTPDFPPLACVDIRGGLAGTVVMAKGTDAVEGIVVSHPSTITPEADLACVLYSMRINSKNSGADLLYTVPTGYTRLDLSGYNRVSIESDYRAIASASGSYTADNSYTAVNPMTWGTMQCVIPTSATAPVQHGGTNSYGVNPMPGASTPGNLIIAAVVSENLSDLSFTPSGWTRIAGDFQASPIGADWGLYAKCYEAGDTLNVAFATMQGTYYCHMSEWVIDTHGGTPTNAPNAGQAVNGELVGIGDGATSSFQTNFQYSPGSLHVHVGGALVVAAETNPSTGTFTLPFTPDAGERVIVGYTASTSTPTGASHALARSATDALPSQMLAAYQLRSEKGAVNGYAGLDATGKVPTSELPSLAPSFATPSVGYGAPAAGSAATTIRSDATIAKPTEADLSLSAVTTANVSTTKHGFAPVLPNDATKYLDGTGGYSVPPGSHVYAPLTASDGSGGWVLVFTPTGDCIMV